MFESNEVLQKLPKHLLNLIIEQPYDDYSSQDHAIWRYVMRQNVRYLSEVAHGSYLDGLKRTGISIEKIPLMYGMNRILQEIGWAAVAVDGFIPPAAFMEFQANNVLVIAADIRNLNQIGYTPAPDIIHEAAGHAPILADPEYAEYLKLFGHYGAKAFSSPLDKEIYRAVRHLSILKADPNSTKKEVQQAEDQLQSLSHNGDVLSELSKIRNLHWWTVEYGLIGSLSNPKLYGAGLLSSMGESFNALSDQVKKLNYSLDAADLCFDITKMQPQLFVTPDFAYLREVLLSYVKQMAFTKGGLDAVKKAINSEQIACAEYDTGLQVSGIISSYIQKNDVLIYFRTNGASSLAYQNKELSGHNIHYHSEGFGSPIGSIKGIESKFELLSDHELEKYGFKLNHDCEFEYDSGIKIKGTLRKIVRKDSKILLLSFDNCYANYNNETLFDASWGIYDMAIGSCITSCYRGAADPESYGYVYPAPKEKTHKIIYSNDALKMHQYFQGLRNLREGKSASKSIKDLCSYAKKNWLLAMEILELMSNSANNNELSLQINNQLKEFRKDDNLTKLIDNGIKLIEVNSLTF